MKKRAYISGPITGRPYKETFNLFNEVEKKLCSEGYTVFNPMKNGMPTDSSWEDMMKADIPNLFDAHVIYLLPGWEDSTGARIEEYIANERNIKRRFHEIEEL